MFRLESNTKWGIRHITALQYASCDIELTPVFYSNSNSSSLFFRFDYYSKKLSRWRFKDNLEEWQKRASYQYDFFFNSHSYWWRIEEDEPDSILIFLSQFDAVKTAFEAQRIKIKDCSERIKILQDTLYNIQERRYQQDHERVVVEKEIEKIVGVSRNDIISIYELASQCCSAYNNLIMLIDKSNAKRYISYAKGTLKQSKYTQDIAEAKYWTERILNFTQPMADFCEKINELYEHTQGIDGKYGKWDAQRPYGKATEFPLLSQSIIHLQRMIGCIPDIIKNGEDKDYVEHCKYMASRQRIY